jgi:hypothetical protein
MRLYSDAGSRGASGPRAGLIKNDPNFKFIYEFPRPGRGWMSPSNRAVRVIVVGLELLRLRRPEPAASACCDIAEA